LAPSPALCSISFSVVEGIVVAVLSAKHMKLTVHPPCFDFSETFNFVLAFLPLLLGYRSNKSLLSLCISVISPEEDLPCWLRLASRGSSSFWLSVEAIDKNDLTCSRNLCLSPIVWLSATQVYLIHCLITFLSY
jgi:hypothetical protein